MHYVSRRAAVAASLAVAAAVCSSGCAGQEDEGPDYADQEVLVVIADGLEERFDFADKTAAEEQTMETFAEATKIEIDALDPYRDRPFEKSDLQELVLAYYNNLKSVYEATQEYNIDDLDFVELWNKYQDERCAMLVTLVEDYGLRVDDDHKDTLEELIRSGKKVTEQREVDEAVQAMLGAITFEKVADQYGLVSFRATVENTCGYALENVYITLGEYDASGVKIEETNAGTTTWAKGERVVLEAFGNEAATSVKIVDSTYDVVEE